MKRFINEKLSEMGRHFNMIVILAACVIWSGCINVNEPIKPSVNPNAVKAVTKVSEHITHYTYEHDGMMWQAIEHDGVGNVTAFTDTGRKQRLGSSGSAGSTAPSFGAGAPPDVEPTK